MMNEKRFPRKKSNFHEYLFYFLRLTFLLALAISILQFCFTFFTMKKTVGENNTKTLALLKNAHEAVLSQIDQSTASLFTDPFYLRYMDYYKKRDFTTLNNIYASLQNIVEGNQSIRAVCIYYRDSGYTLSSDMGPAPAADYHDADFLYALDTMDLHYSYTTTRLVTYPKKPEESVITIIRSLPIFYSSAHPSAYVIIDVDRKYIDNTLRAIAGAGKEILVTDANRNVVAQTGSTYDPFDSGIDFENMTPNTYQVLAVNGQQFIVSFAENQSNGWRYLFMEPMAKLINLRSLILIIFAIGAICFVFSIPLAAASSRKIVMPIRHIAERITDAGNAGQGRETDRILSSIDHMLEDNRRLESQWENGKNTEMQRKIADLIRGELRAEEAQPILAQTGLVQFNGTKMRLAILECDGPDDVMGKFSKEYIYKTQVGMNRYVLIMAAEEAEERIEDCLPQAFLPSDAVIGLSAVFDSVDQLKNAFSQAYTAIDRRLTEPEKQIFIFNPSTDTRALRYPIVLEKEILSAMKQHVIPEVKRSLEKFGGYIMQNGGDPETIRSCYLQLYCALQRLAQELGPDAVSRIRGFGHSQLMESHSVQQMNEYLAEMYEQILDCDGIRKIEGSTSLIDDVCRYIDDHLEEDLSAARLSEIFGISSSHLRRLFQTEKQCTIKQYTDLRKVDKSKAMLENSTVKIQDIAIATGFLSSQAFVKFFKGIVGMTPGEYRFIMNIQNREEKQ